MPPDQLGPLFWPAADWVTAEEALLHHSGLALATSYLPRAPERASPFEKFMWFRRAPRAMGIDLREEKVSREMLFDRLVLGRGPCLVTFQREGTAEFWAMALLLDRGGRASALRMDGSHVTLNRADVSSAIIEALGGRGPLGQLFDGLPNGDAAREEFFRAGGVASPVLNLYWFELDGAHSLRTRLASAGAWRSLALHVALQVLRGAILLGAMWTLGSSAIEGRIDPGRVVGWAVLMLSDAGLGYVSARALGSFTNEFSIALKRRLLEGVFYVEESEIRGQGFGFHIARTNEISAVERLSLADASGLVLSIFQLLGSIIIFVKGALPAVFIGAVCAATLAIGLVSRTFVLAYLDVYKKRIGLTDDMVEKIIGHRTRAVQENRGRLHVGEDAQLSDYARAMRKLDHARVALSISGRAWLVAAEAVLLACLILQTDLARLFVSALGVGLVFFAFSGVAPAIERVVECLAAWRGIEQLSAAGRTRDRPPREHETIVDAAELPIVLSVSALSFAHRTGGKPIFSDAEMKIRRGEKVLLEGSSGSGKTTLFKLIAGEQRVAGGIILVGGVDCFSVSQREWRSRVGSAPQFHENYIFANTFAFNLNPAGYAQNASDEARAICEELGLGPVIARMPQGFAQLMGETGWQLSHGERSRVFIARALLQRSDLLLFDESFGALDPETLLLALNCVQRRAKTLVVIAHT